VYEAPTIIGTCINCIAPASLSVTLALIVIGASIALTVDLDHLKAERLAREAGTKAKAK
jgi:hypothetical protein